MNFEFELTSTLITSNAGLAFIGSQLEDPTFDRQLDRLCPHKGNKGRIPDGDIAKTMMGLICVGKPYFDAVAEYTDDSYFRHARRLILRIFEGHGWASVTMTMARGPD